MALSEVLGSVLETVWKYNMVIMMLLFVAYNHWKSKQPFPEAGGRTIGIKNHQEFDDLMAQKGMVIVDFYATWCPPCRMAAPVFGELSETFTGAEFVKVDVDQCNSVAKACKVSSMPTFQLYRDGKLVDSVVGFSKAKMESMLKKHHVSAIKKVE
mmetsp:Transcript_20803/g.24588  ORF Transcript_20803/g.24588 Transcript_20803/m.24588 type:complete len:155 (-) Transcript_20803:106-570(-)